MNQRDRIKELRAQVREERQKQIVKAQKDSDALVAANLNAEEDALKRELAALRGTQVADPQEPSPPVTPAKAPAATAEKE